jgi:1-acyl-sn-glycerol-3-phosphate acyltransferase
MKGVFQHPLRVGTRLVWLTGEVFWAALCFVPFVLLYSNSSDLVSRARWLQYACRRALRIFNLELRAAGPLPERGLLVSNHLGYLDILILSALTPSVFVAKSEVRNWPVFGWFSTLGGTLFTDRKRHIQVGPLNRELRNALAAGALVVLFPEGTSSDGQTVLPFKSALLEPVTNNRHPLCASLIEYCLDDGDVGEELCYWKDMMFLPHLLNLLSKKRIKASVQFCKLSQGSMNRKDLARHLHSQVLLLKERGNGSIQPSERAHFHQDQLGEYVYQSCLD